MEMREFANTINATLQAKGYNSSINTVTKNNGIEYTGVIIKKDNTNLAPTIYLESYLKDYEEDNRTMESIITAIITVAEREPDMVSFETGSYTEWDKVKETIIMKIINKDRNANLLETVPFAEFCDLAIIFQSLVDVDNGLATITVADSHLEMWGKTVEDLFELAKVNTPKLLPAKMQTMNDVMISMGMPEELLPPFEPEKEMYILSNEHSTNGVATILYDDCRILHSLASDIGTNLYILPSSIHEVILMSTNAGEPNVLSEMVKEVNGTQVLIEEQLSDNVYLYDRETNVITIA